MKSNKIFLIAALASLISAIAALVITSSSAAPPPSSVPGEIASLQSQVAALTATVSALQRQLSLVASNPALKLGPFVTVDPRPRNLAPGPNIVFTGANIHIVNGTGDTSITNGTGNLIIGYDELPWPNPQGRSPANGAVYIDPEALQRMGSHNVVVGRGHIFQQYAFGGLIAGEWNAIAGEGNSVLGGMFNYAGGYNSSILGGSYSYTGGEYATVAGGWYNFSTGFDATILAGYDSVASGGFSIVITGPWLNATGYNQILPAYAPASSTPAATLSLNPAGKNLPFPKP